MPDFSLSTDSVKKTRLKNHTDHRPVSWGFARIIMVLLVFLSCLTLGREISLFHGADNIPYSLLNLWAVLMWLLITAGVIHNGRKMRRIAFSCLFIEIMLVLSVPVVKINASQPHLLNDFGAFYFYFPSLMLLITTIWLIYSSPFRQK